MPIQSSASDYADLRRRIDPEEFKRRTKRTNFRPDGGPAGRGGSTITFGEGSGSNLGLDKPKHDVWLTPKESAALEETEADEAIEKAKRKAAGIAKAQRTRGIRKNRLLEIKAALDTGDMLQGQRLFHLAWQKKKWEIRINQFGGMPEGVDIAYSQFGELLLVPVVEKSKAAELKLTGGYTDRDGRPFWVALGLRKSVEQIFGRVRWDQALQVQEAVQQFGIRLS